MLAFIKDDIGLGGAMSLLDSSRGGEGSSHLDDLDALEQVAGLHPDVATFERWLRDRLATGGWGGEGPGVTLSTVHRVKGMEWDKVAVFGVNAGILPHRLAEDVEEERRVLHVALTRCRQPGGLADRREPAVADAGRAGRRPRHARSARAAAASAAAGVSRGEVGPLRGGRGTAAAAAGSGPSGPSGPSGASGVAEGRSGSRSRSGARERVVAHGDPVDEQALRTWRSERSRRDNVPAFIVLHDATLGAIAAARPSTLVALRRIEGIGPAKLEMYGDEILAVLAGVRPVAQEGPPAQAATAP